MRAIFAAKASTSVGESCGALKRSLHNTWQRIAPSDAGVLVFLALFFIVLHTLTNGQYGFHRDQLATLDDARYLAWGYVVYPPVTPFLARR